MCGVCLGLLCFPSSWVGVVVAGFLGCLGLACGLLWLWVGLYGFGLRVCGLYALVGFPWLRGGYLVRFGFFCGC